MFTAATCWQNIYYEWKPFRGHGGGLLLCEALNIVARRDELPLHEATPDDCSLGGGIAAAWETWSLCLDQMVAAESHQLIPVSLDVRSCFSVSARKFFHSL